MLINALFQLFRFLILIVFIGSCKSNLKTEPSSELYTLMVKKEMRLLHGRAFLCLNFPKENEEAELVSKVVATNMSRTNFIMLGLGTFKAKPGFFPYCEDIVATLNENHPNSQNTSTNIIPEDTRVIRISLMNANVMNHGNSTHAGRRYFDSGTTDFHFLTSKVLSTDHSSSDKIGGKLPMRFKDTHINIPTLASSRGIINAVSALDQDRLQKRAKAFLSFILLHELGHAIGLEHEHNRADNFQNSSCSDFDANPYDWSDILKGSNYDNLSVMSYCRRDEFMQLEEATAEFSVRDIDTINCLYSESLDCANSQILDEQDILAQSGDCVGELWPASNSGEQELDETQCNSLVSYVVTGEVSHKKSCLYEATTMRYMKCVYCPNGESSDPRYWKQIPSRQIADVICPNGIVAAPEIK